MSTLQIGNQLARSFCSKGVMLHVITETAGNKISTKVFDSTGKTLLKERVKTVEHLNVGNKKVVSITKETKQDLAHPENVGTVIVGRVFKPLRILSDIFLGAIKTIVNKDGSKIVKKFSLSQGSSKFIDNGKRTYRKECFYGDVNITPSDFWYRGHIESRETLGKKLKHHDSPVYYNDKGLPIPTILNKDKEKYAQNTLQEMLFAAKEAESASHIFSPHDYPIWSGLDKIQPDSNTFLSCLAKKINNSLNH